MIKSTKIFKCLISGWTDEWLTDAYLDSNLQNLSKSIQ